MTMIRWLRATITSWWGFRDVTALDIDIGAAGDEGYLLIHTGRRFKRPAVLDLHTERYGDHRTLAAERNRRAATARRRTEWR